MPKTTRINIISGFLGAGKTTVLNALMGMRPADEQWAVLVNEYGEVGIDAALLHREDLGSDIALHELPGGCICCTAGLQFTDTLTELLTKLQPDRLLIEPTGLASLTGVIDTLNLPHIRDRVDLRTNITLIDPVVWSMQKASNTPDTLWEDQIQAADVLLITRADLYDAHLIEDAVQEASDAFFPAKQFVGSIAQGNITPDLLDLVQDRNAPKPHQAHDHSHHHEHHHGHEHPHSDGNVSIPAYTTGWTFKRDVLFDVDHLERWIMETRRQEGFLRLKGVFHTTEGWWNHNITTYQHDASPSSHRRDSRLEIIVRTPFSEQEHAAIEEQLQNCLAV